MGVPKKPTMADIARAANVAVSTVSKVFNGHSDVSAGTRGAIERLLADFDYQRPRAVRPRGRRGDLVELVINNLDSAWSLAILAGVEKVAETAGFGLVVSAVHDGDRLNQRWAEDLLSRGSQGAILVASQLSVHQHIEMARRRLPIVVVDGSSKPSSDVASVGATNFAGGYSAAEHLIRLGHRRIGAIGGPAQLRCTRARIGGFRAALKAHGLAADPVLVRYGNFRHDGGLFATQRLLALPDPPTAIFAGNDQQATGVYEAVRRRGGRVPADLSVVGFDDLNFAAWTNPALTTVRQPLYEMGAVAGRTLLRIIGGERLETCEFELATRLVVRESAGALPSG